MKDHVSERVKQVVDCYINTQMTVRGIAKLFGVSKSTVHTDLTIRAKEVIPELQDEVNSIVKKHKLERHINGGIATKRKYEELRLKNLEQFGDNLNNIEKVN